MPQSNNISSPITIVSFGRSGTSLLGAIFERHPDIDFIGETAQLIFSTWLGVEQSTQTVRKNFNQPWNASWEASDDTFCAAAVHGVFERLFPSARPRWMHKPIGIPNAFYNPWFADQDVQSWYWRVFTTCFPAGKTITILRNPIDVAVSAHLYWGFAVEAIIEQLGQMAALIVHPQSTVDYAVNFDELSRRREPAVRELCAAVDLEYRAEMLTAFATSHAPQPGNDPAARQGEAIAKTLEKILAARNLAATLLAVTAMWRKFGHEPPDFIASSTYVQKNRWDLKQILEPIGDRV